MCLTCREKAKKTSREVSCEGCENAQPEVLENNQKAWWFFGQVLPVLFYQGRIDLENVSIMLDTYSVSKIERPEIIKKLLILAQIMKTGGGGNPNGS